MGNGKKILHFIEYAGAWLGVSIVRHTPCRLSCSIAAFVADVAFLFAAKRRRTAIENIIAAKITDDRKMARRIARKSFESIAMTVAESFIPPATDGKPGITLDVVAPDDTRALFHDPAQGVIIVSGHIGNWESTAQFVSQTKIVTGVARRMNNPRVQALMDAAKMRDKFETFEKHEVKPMQLVRSIRKGNAIALLTDQHAHGSAVIVDFLGRPAATYPSPAVLQRLTGAPIIFACTRRKAPLHIEVSFSEPLFYKFAKDSVDADILAATQDLSNRLADSVRKYPEQYLWAHRRWKVAEKNGK